MHNFKSKSGGMSLWLDIDKAMDTQLLNTLLGMCAAKVMWPDNWLRQFHACHGLNLDACDSEMVSIAQ